MTSKRFSAPGKVILCGEYAVLRGAPAVVMAVDRRAVVTVEPGGDGTRCIGLGGRTDTRLVDCVLSALRRERPAAQLTLDTGAFRDGSEKLGIGSSAALAAALTAALATDDSKGREQFETAQQAHREFQQGRGSGADVAASHAGGIIVYRMHDAATHTVSWPFGLHYSLFWTGKSVSTKERVTRFDASAEHPATGALLTAAEDLASVWQAGGAADVLAGYGPYMEALTEFDEAHRLGIFDGGHAELAVAEPDLIYKPCGAGGGDVGIALSTDKDRLEAFAALAAGLGVRRLEIAIDTRGVGEDPYRG